MPWFQNGLDYVGIPVFAPGTENAGVGTFQLKSFMAQKASRALQENCVHGTGMGCRYLEKVDPFLGRRGVLEMVESGPLHW